MPDARDQNRLWADLLVEELVRGGVGLFCLAPGSRSTPLTVAVASNPRAKHLLHFDERGTAFAALGYARATGRPAAWITTSGTAVANGLPAVIEASVDGVPLILLTADRPPELRDTGANQTIPQPYLFGEYVRWRFDLPTPTPDIDPAFVLTTADQALHRAMGPPAGPVHLNGMFRKPLAPERLDAPVEIPDGLQRWAASSEPYTCYSAPSRVVPDDVRAFADRLREVERGLVVAGRLATRAEGAAAVRLAEALGWPLLPDIGSQARFVDSSVACPFYDQVLGSAAFAGAHAPEAVVHLGGRSTSKRLAQFVAQRRPQTLAVVRDDPFRFDPSAGSGQAPGHRVTDRIEADVAAWCDAVASHGRGAASTDWLDAWRRASAAADDLLAVRFGEADALSEPHVGRVAAQQAGAGLVLAASMPVRDADAFAVSGGAQPLVVSNRGASGIDGTVATAAGVARGLGVPVTLLIGDLALLHDLNSLALLRDPNQPPVTVVAVNNDGGGIFHFLPIAEHDGVFEPYFGTPHGLGFEHAAAQFGLTYYRLDTPGAFAAALTSARASGSSALIEVRTDRSENRALHADLLARVARAVDETLAAEPTRS
jgi:2-succinyl-5-enolpyruvyl-6-hydroxy-3-cyclohexene-1-carboxylate synthase